MCVHFVFLDESWLERFFILVQTTAIEILGYARGQQWAYLFNPFLWTSCFFSSPVDFEGSNAQATSSESACQVQFCVRPTWHPFHSRCSQVLLFRIATTVRTRRSQCLCFTHARGTECSCLENGTRGCAVGDLVVNAG